MQFIRENSTVLLAGILYAALSGYLIWQDMSYLTFASFGMIAVYLAVYHVEYAYLGLAFLTPLSVNIEEYTDSFGLFIPTEPLLFGLMLLFFMKQLNSGNIVDKAIWKNPIVLAACFYLFWTFVTSITSSNPVASFKFLLAKLWFIIPLLFLGPAVMKKRLNIQLFLWLMSIAMVIAILYTLTIHASYGFGEKEGHWVMWPFFKDHTIYGSAVALIIPVLFSIYFSKKHNPLIQVTLIGMMVITLVGLYFSYTRAAWLSVIAALMVLAAIKLKIHFKYLAAVGLIAGTVVLFSWDQIQMELERNKYEHTTEEFGERFQSAANVTTDASNLERLNRWSCAIAMFKERPMFGFGPGTYAFEYARFQDPENLTIISTNFGNLGNAHSEYLGPLSEMGFFGLVAILAIVAAIFYQSINLYIKWPKEDVEMRTLILGMILALVTYFVHGVLNNYLDTDKASVPIWGFCAIFIALELSLSNGRSIAKDSNS
ncbi:MAG: O-antigen ligase family protein [Crocinitomicaceae bacterium]